MRQMKPASAKTLTWLAAILAVMACMVMSPSGALFLLAAAALAALFPSVFSRGKVRLVAMVLLLLSLGLAVQKYPAFRHEQAAYRQHQQKGPHQPLPGE